MNRVFSPSRKVEHAGQSDNSVDYASHVSGRTQFVNTHSAKWSGLTLFRGALFLFALLLACQAIWILTAEVSLPSLPDFPSSSQAASAAAADRNGAARAARFGFIRGDLWAKYALTYLSLVQADEANNDAQNSETIQQARQVADRALALAPYDARIWLVLAGIDTRFNWLNHKPGAPLRMSYYTGANKTELIPLRLLLAFKSQALVEEDIQQLVRHDIRIVVTHKPELEPAVIAAYRNALPSNRQFLEDTLQEIDPALLARIRAKR